MSPLGDIQPQVSLHLKAKNASAPVVFGGEIAEICQKVRERKSIYTARRHVCITLPTELSPSARRASASPDRR